jgi:hypothetical protein
VRHETTKVLSGERYEGEYRDIWDDHKHSQEFEHNLINRKTTWSLTAQTLLFAAYGVVFGIKTSDVKGNQVNSSNVSSDLRNTIAAAGLAIAVLTFIGILALVRSKYLSWKLYEGFFDNCAEKEDRLPRPLTQLDWGVRTRNTMMTLSPDLMLPVIFAAAWVALLARG